MLSHSRVLRVVLPILVLGLTACTTTSNRIVRSEFEDIPVPRGLSFVEDRSTIIESPTVKAARMIYRGRIEPVSLASALRSTFESNGWRPISATTTSPQGTLQVYEKSGTSLQVRVWEEIWFTYVEVTSARALGPAANTAQR